MTTVKTPVRFGTSGLHDPVAENLRLDSPETETSDTISRLSEVHCGEHQFRCANSSECIAIYDVCNGIPQCTDGSDEAESLDCHARDGKQLAKQVDIGDQLVYDIIRPVLQVFRVSLWKSSLTESAADSLRESDLYCAAEMMTFRD